MSNTKLIKALRCKTSNVNDCTMCAYHNACYDGTLENIAADVLEADEQRIADLETQMPKEGEWIDIDGTMFAECSVCGKRHYGCTTPYCDMCGARMRKGEQE